MTPNERAEFLEANLSRQLQMIGVVDGRAGLVLAINMAMLGVLAALTPKAEEWALWGAVSAVLAAVALLVSLLFLVFASHPRTKGPKGSLLYFEGIACREQDAYIREVRGLDLDSYIGDLAKQCHRNAQIAQTKYGWLQRSLVSLYVSIIPWLLALFLLYQSRQ